MAFPKPEFIQNFVEEKLKRGKENEKSALLQDDRLSQENELNLENNNRNKKPKSDAFHYSKAASPPSSVFSESDEPSRNRGYHSANETAAKARHKSLASDADCETDDSEETKRRRAVSSTLPHKTSTRRLKDSRSSLKTDGVSNNGYGGTSEVEVDCAEALATYAPKEAVKGPRKAGGNVSAESKRSDKSIKNGENSKEHHRSFKKEEQKREHTNGQPCSYDHKHDDDSSNSEDLFRSSRRSSMESEHCHDSSDERSEKDEQKRKKAMRKLMIATVLSFIFMVGEVVGGYLANSLAVMTDASHLLTDVSSFMISIVALKMASRPISKKMTFGWHRAEVIGALISVLAIWVVTGILVYLAVRRLVTNDYEVNGRNMLITAGLAVGFNIIMGVVLHEHGHIHGHSHGHSHAHNHDHESASNASGAEEEESGNVNVRAAFIHVVGDLLQSLGVLIAAFIIYFKPSYKIADPICTFLFSILVIVTTLTILRDTVVIIMEGSPVNIEYNVVKEKLLEIEGVTAVHDIRIWSLTLNQTVMSGHLAIDKYADPSVILKRATRKLKALYDFHSLTIQVEYYSDDMDSCKRCQPA